MQDQEIQDVIGLLHGELYTKRHLKLTKEEFKSNLQDSRPIKSLDLPSYNPQPISPYSVRYLKFIPWDGQFREKKSSSYQFTLIGMAAGLVKHLLQANGFEQTTTGNPSIIWNNGVVRPQTYGSMSAYQKINHFPKSFEMTRKDLLYHNLTKATSKYKGLYNFVPKTYVLPNDVSLFSEEGQRRKGLWIIKPHNSSQGKGIWVCDKVQQILKRVKETVVVSEYVQNPLLVDGLKFDLRIYVSITCFNPLRIYIYREGLARFATYKYSKDHLDNPFVHLTNYSLNKHSDKFIDSPEDGLGSKWSLQALLGRLKDQGYDTQLIMSRIDDLVIKTVISIENPVFAAAQSSVPFRNNCFQLLGFDVLLDYNLKPWLLQVNLSPSLNTDSEIDLRIKGTMLADLFTMIGIVAIDQRFSTDKSYLNNDNKQYKKRMNAKTDFGRREYTKQQQLIINQSEEEDKRSSGWRKIYPLADSQNYKRLFEIDRYFNALLRDFQTKKSKSKINSYINK